MVQPLLQFNFGFATDEAFLANQILDSFTISIQSTDQQFTAVFLTTDASGTVLAPATPGAVEVPASTISLTPIPYPPLAPILGSESAFAVSAAIPQQFWGSPINVYFDLFDNGDVTASQGWLSDVKVSTIPEPGCWDLLFGAGLAFWSMRRFRK